MRSSAWASVRRMDSPCCWIHSISRTRLIAGITGSGKSVLMQNLILSIAATRTPAEAHIYLIDPKFGVDYRPLDELPHVEVGSGGIIDDPHAAVQMLEGLVDEMNRRYELFKAAKVPNVHAYRRGTGNQLPILWIMHDEFADWMQTDDYRDAVPNIVGRLSVKARAAGIFLLFAAQRPDKDVMPMQLRSQLGNRLILKVDNAATAEIAMGTKNSGAERLLGRGHMLAKTGDTPEAVFAQVPYIDIERTVPQLVRLIRAAARTAAGCTQMIYFDNNSTTRVFESTVGCDDPLSDAAVCESRIGCRSRKRRYKGTSDPKVRTGKGPRS